MSDPTLGSVLDAWIPDDPQRIVLADVTATNTVQLAGESTAITLPALSTVVAGQTAAVLVASGSRLILGPVNNALNVTGGTDVDNDPTTGALIISTGAAGTLNMDANEVQSFDGAGAPTAWAVQPFGGDVSFGVLSGGASLRWAQSEGELRDGAGRQFIRSNSSATAVLQQWGVWSATTNGSGIGSVTFAEPFGSTPVIQTQRQTGNSATRGQNVHGVTVNGFDFTATSPAGAQTNTSMTVMWTAIGPIA